MKKFRNCPFIPLEETNNEFKIAISTRGLGKLELDYCPNAFLNQNLWCKVIYEARTALIGQFPIYHNCGYLELPNILIEGITILNEELEDGDSTRKS